MTGPALTQPPRLRARPTELAACPRPPRPQFRGVLRVPRPGRAHFQLTFTGAARLLVNGQALPLGAAAEGEEGGRSCRLVRMVGPQPALLLPACSQQGGCLTARPPGAHLSCA